MDSSSTSQTVPSKFMLRRLPAVLRDEPRYRILFFGQFLSIFGDRVTALVLPFAVLSIGGSVGDIAIVSIAQFVPFAILALPAGVWADRWNRRWIVICSDAARMCCQAAAALLLTHTARVLDLVAVAAVYGSSDAFFSPAVTGLIPTTVAAENVQAANALRGATYSLGAILGPLIGGGLIALIGPGGAFAFDAISFLVSIVFLLRLRPLSANAQRPEQDPPAVREGMLTGLRLGWSAVRERSWVLAFLIGWASYSILVLPVFFVLGPVLMSRSYDGAPSWALVTVGFGLGALAGDLLLLRCRPRYALRIGALAFIGATAQVLIVVSGLNIVLIALLMVPAGACVTGCYSLWQTTLQEHIPDATLSRVSSYDYLTSTGLIPIGTLLAGILSPTIGLRPAMLLMGGAAVIIGCLIAANPAVRHLPRPQPASEPTDDEPHQDTSQHNGWPDRCLNSAIRFPISPQRQL